MKLHQLQALVAAVEHGSIRAAARERHLTQAALTKSLRQLEEDAGVALLVRKSRGVALTEAGLRLHARALLVMRQLALAQDELQQAQGDETGTVRVAITPYLMLTVLGEAFLWFRKRYPHIELRLIEGLVARVLPGLRDGTVDFAIVADSGDVTPQEFQCTRLQKDQQKLVVRAGHPVLRQPTAAKLVELEWVMPGSVFAGAGRRVVGYVLEGRCATTHPDHALRRHGGHGLDPANRCHERDARPFVSPTRGPWPGGVVAAQHAPARHRAGLALPPRGAAHTLQRPIWRGA
jgi:DNA-binding transcriptional LysR family regulator